MTQTVINDIAAILSASDNIVLITHLSPDGDCIGSSLGLYGALKTLGKRVTILCDGLQPGNLNQLPWIEEIQFTDNDEDSWEEKLPSFTPEVVVAVDCADLERLGRFAAIFQETEKQIVIDHHRTNVGFGHVNWIDPISGATAEMIYQLVVAMNIKLDASIASCIYAGIISDTGNFSYNNTRSETFEIAAKLIQTGFSMPELVHSMFRVRTREYADVLAIVVSQMKFFEQGRIVMAILDKETQMQHNFSADAYKGIVDFLRDQEGVEVAIFIKERWDGDGFRTSFRSQKHVDVASICESLGGGGHKNAAGCLVTGTYYSVGNQLLELAQEALRKAE